MDMTAWISYARFVKKRAETDQLVVLMIMITRTTCGGSERKDVKN